MPRLFLARFLCQALVHLPISAIGKSFTRVCLSSLYSQAMPVSDAGLALSVLDMCQSVTSILAPLYGGLLIDHFGVAAEPLLAAASYVFLLLLVLLLVPAPPGAPGAASAAAKKRE